MSKKQPQKLKNPLSPQKNFPKHLHEPPTLIIFTLTLINTLSPYRTQSPRNTIALDFKFSLSQIFTTSAHPLNFLESFRL